MLDKNTLAQLSELKTAIVSSKEYGEGTVVGSNGRYGFVRLDDGRDAFLNPEKMQHVLPGDRVRISITKNDKEQLEGTFEKLLEQGLKRFVGIYKTKGKTHFVLPDTGQFSRWIFIPPQQRQHSREGDYVVAELTKHPYDDGKASAKVVARLGPPDEPFIEHKLTIAKHGLFRYWPKDVTAQANALSRGPLDLNNREDLTSVPFVTIDNASTLDMDDALYAEKNSDGWTLQVAIADPASYIEPGSPLSKIARDNSQTVYLPGETLSMLPETLATDVFSLKENEQKPALVITLSISTEGAVISASMAKALVSSHKKLSYDAVAALIDEQSPLELPEQHADAITQSLQALAALSQARRDYREQHHLISDDQTQYRFELDPQGKIQSITPQNRNIAHKMVEEAMVAANAYAGNILAEHKAGIHTTQTGFRAERFGEVKALLKEEFDGNVPEGLDSLNGYTNFIRTLKNHSEKAPLLSPLKRMMQPSVLSTDAQPHLNMGFEHYATITSPIRRYCDLSNHWALHQILAEKKPAVPASKTLETINATLDAGRQANRELELWLKSQFANTLVGSTFTGMIRVVTQQGFGVRVDENGLEGFVQFGKNTEKKYDAKRMTLTVEGKLYSLDTPVTIKIAGVDLDKRRVQFEVVESK